MDIQIRNIQTDERTVFKQVDPTVAACLCAAGIAQPYEKPQPATVTATWGTSLGRRRKRGAAPGCSAANQAAGAGCRQSLY